MQCFITLQVSKGFCRVSAYHLSLNSKPWGQTLSPKSPKEFCACVAGENMEVVRKDERSIVVTTPMFIGLLKDIFHATRRNASV